MSSAFGTAGVVIAWFWGLLSPCIFVGAVIFNKGDAKNDDGLGCLCLPLLGAGIAGGIIMTLDARKTMWRYFQFAVVQDASLCEATWPHSRSVSCIFYFSEAVISNSAYGHGTWSKTSSSRRGKHNPQRDYYTHTVFFQPIWGCDPFAANATCAITAPCAFATSWSPMPDLNCGSLRPGICGVSYDNGPGEAGSVFSPKEVYPNWEGMCTAEEIRNEIRNAITTAAQGNRSDWSDMRLPDGIPLLHMSRDTNPDFMERRLRHDFDVVLGIAAMMIAQQLVTCFCLCCIMTFCSQQPEETIGQPEETIQQPETRGQPRDTE